MASVQYQENQVALNDMFYESHSSLIERVCIALGQVEKIDELKTMLLGEKMKIKFKKDPNKPKKPKSGFLFFCDEVRGKIIEDHKKSNGKVVIGDVAKELGKLWKKLTNANKKKYNAMKENDKQRYAEEMEDYNTKLYAMN
tara:strand:+ start:131 stop:553 length:423 start_codon:yes stop_codon:yes gene_type:complete